MSLMQEQPDYFPQSSCLLVIAKWAPASHECLKVFNRVKQELETENIQFQVRDFDEDYTEQCLEKYDIKAAPLWRFCSGDKIEYQQYGGNLSVVQLKELIKSYLEQS